MIVNSITKKSALSMFSVSLLAIQSHACFDTYLFLQKQSMVYPKGMLAAEGIGEYTFQNMDEPAQDVTTLEGNLYYGISQKFSVQIGLSSEGERGAQYDRGLSLRAVTNLYSSASRQYSLDGILQHNTNIADPGSIAYEVSFPSLFYSGKMTYVFHPVMGYDKGRFDLRGHGGLFFAPTTGTLLGLGTEFESAQSSSGMGKRLVESQFATSLFFGAYIGNSLFLQNELIRGYGNGAKDYGFATTIKWLIKR